MIIPVFAAAELRREVFYMIRTLHTAGPFNRNRAVGPIRLK